MPAFGKQLQAAELAAVITFTRNALGNSKGDEIQAKDINALLGGGASAAPASEPAKPKTTEKPKTAEQASHPAQVQAQAPEPTPSKKPKTVAKEDDQVEMVQFAQDKFYPQKRVTDKPDATATDTTPSKAQPAATKSELSLDELVKKGESVYETNCQSCHQPGGVGMPPVFPALKGSPVVTGKIDAQVELMLKGKAVMPAFEKSLNAVDFAAVLAYTRNKLNSSGDFKQPSEIEALQNK